MTLLIALDAALRQLLAHKFRSTLATLGIVLGVSSLIATLSLTAGIERGTQTTIQTLGGLQRVEVVNRPIENPFAQPSQLTPPLNSTDASRLRTLYPSISHVSPELRRQLPISSPSHPPSSLRVQGIYPDFFAIENLTPSTGRSLSWLDETRASRVAVIGSSIASRFFPNLHPSQILGRQISLNQKPYTIVGILPLYERELDKIRRQRGLPVPQRTRNRWDPYRLKNESILIPFSTMFYDFPSAGFENYTPVSTPVDALTFRIHDLEQLQETLNEAQALLLFHRKQIQNFDIITRQEFIAAMQSSLRATRISGGLIATISLVVGAIGITNIMLAGISERIREFGIRLAIGARPSDIFLQVLTESLLISLLGALLGIAASFLLADLLVLLAPSENAPILTPNSFLLATSFALLAGTLAGIYPALRAAKLHPSEALRWE